MEELKFKTNIKCSGCVAQVTPALNETVGDNNWTVDTTDPDKILTVSGENTDKDEIKKALEKAGFRAEAITQ
jgi:copper chaperone CopZ